MQPTPVLLHGEPHGQRSLARCSPWGHRESDTTERLALLLLLYVYICVCMRVICMKNMPQHTYVYTRFPMTPQQLRAHLPPRPWLPSTSIHQEGSSRALWTVVGSSRPGAGKSPKGAWNILVHHNLRKELTEQRQLQCLYPGAERRSHSLRAFR